MHQRPVQGIEPQSFLLTVKEVTDFFTKTIFGSTGRDRTYDQLVNSQLHYRCATVEYISLAHYPLPR